MQERIVPIVHLNGTSNEDLIEGYCEACEKLREAYEAVRNTVPNGRDYYVHSDPKAMQRAQEEHRNRMLVLHNLQIEFEAIIEAIEEGEVLTTFRVRE